MISNKSAQLKDQPMDGLVKRAFSREIDPVTAISELKQQLGDGPFALVVVFMSPRFFKPVVADTLNAVFGDIELIGCTTAGEITPEGFADGQIVAVGFPSSEFAASVQMIRPEDTESESEVPSRVLNQLIDVARKRSDWQNDFAFLLNDGLALNEDKIISLISPALGPTQLFGGSAGDGLDFQNTALFCKGAFHQRISLLTIVRTRCRLSVFRFEHYEPTNTRMVVTSADPKERLVSEINGEPAAEEYARMVGKDPKQLSPLVFAASPVMVQVRGQYHVRSIQKVEDTGELRFFSAIDEGLVLTVAQAGDIVSHLETELAKLSTERAPDAIIACECILRKIEIEQIQATGKISDILTENKVVGFHTYGEQFNMLHVNQTFTGVALYAPEVDGG